MDFGILVFLAIVALVVRGLIRSVNTGNSAKSAARRKQFHDLAQRMRATAQQSRPSFPQPPTATYGQEVGGPGYQQPPTAQPGSTAPYTLPPPPQSVPTASVTPPAPPFTARWPSGAPVNPPQPPRLDPVVVEVAADPAPDSAYPVDEPTSSALSPDTTGDAAAPRTTRRSYELSSSLDTTLSTSLTSSLIGQQGSVAEGPQTVPLPPDVRQQVVALMGQGYEVMAVRLVCDEMDVGILEAQNTVRAVAGPPVVS